MITLREYSNKISSMWFYEANGNDTPDTVSYGSTREFTWKCNNNPKHVFKKKVNHMFNKAGKPIGCIYCEAERPVPFPGETDLFTILPIARDMWDYDKNIGFDTNCIHPGTPTKAWFKCENGHSFQRDICRFVKNQDCPTCKELKNVIAKFPHMVKQWHFEKNVGVDINLTSANSSQTVWWKCKKCKYEWMAKISSRHASKGLCPCCEVRIVVQDGATDLFTLFPALKEEYDFEKNKDIDDSLLSVTTLTPVWWKCKAGHEWKVSPSTRIQSRNGKQLVSKCPHCQGKKRLISYAEEYPELNQSFMADKNGRAFDTVTAKERCEKFWWLCNTCKNEFESSTQAMVRSYSTFAKGCPYCAGKKVKKENSFAVLHPGIMDEYDPKNEIDPYTVTEKSDKTVKWICRNNPKHRWSISFRQRAIGSGNCPECRGWHYNKMLWQERPDLEKYYDTAKNIRSFNSYSYMSNEKAWWVCEEGHSFETMIMNLSRREHFECPVCENRIIIKGFNDLESQYPDLAQEFHAIKNQASPDSIYYASTYQYWWKCKEGHEFLRSAYHRTMRVRECPICNKQIVIKGINDFQHTYPEIVNIWDYSKNDVSPDEISDINSYKYFFKCKKGHEYEAGLGAVRYNGCICLVCNNIIVQSGVNSLVETHPELAQEFSPCEERRPDEFLKNMSYSILWRCPTCGGDYKYPIKNRALNDNSCPYCNRNRPLLGFNSLVDTHPDLAKEWSPNNERGPETYIKNVGIYVKWICPKCNGEYSADISKREFNDDSCPYCNNKRALLGVNSLVDTHPELAAEWSTNNDKSPSEVLKDYGYQVKWICPECNGEYIAKISERELGDDSCPYCNRKRALLGFNSLIDTHPKLALEWAKSNRRGPETFIKENRKYVRWECPTCTGEYWAKLCDREVGDDSCPYCRNIKPLKNYNTLAIRHRDLMAEWDYVNNYLLCDPNQIIDKYSRNVWWICKECEYKYLMSPNQKVYYKKRKMKSCPKCKGMRRKKSYFL